jgi:hypothetical protein
MQVDSVEEASIMPVTVTDLYCLSPEEMVGQRFFRVYPESELEKVRAEEARLKARTKTDTQVWYTMDAFDQYIPEDIFNVDEAQLYGGTGLVHITESYYAEDELELMESLDAIEGLDDSGYELALTVYRDAVRGKPNAFGATDEFKQKATDELGDGMRFFRTEESIYSATFDGHRFAMSPTSKGWVSLKTWSGATDLGAGPRIYATDLPLTFTQRESCRKAALAWAKNKTRRVKTEATV